MAHHAGGQPDASLTLHGQAGQLGGQHGLRPDAHAAVPTAGPVACEARGVHAKIPASGERQLAAAPAHMFSGLQASL